MATKKKQRADNAFKRYLRENGNEAGLEYIEELERAGHKLTEKGGGYIGKFTMEAVQGYDVFAQNENKRLYAEILQNVSGAGTAAMMLAYCIIPGSAHVLVKADSETVAKIFVDSVNQQFEKLYDNGACSVGNPFRLGRKAEQVSGARALMKAIGNIHGYSIGDFHTYPYNSYNYLMQGNTTANLILGIELNITDISTFYEKLEEATQTQKYYNNAGKENLNEVLEEMRKKYVYPYGRVKEEAITFMISEACTRCGLPYEKVAKKMHMYKGRHDLVVSTLANHMIRRKSSFNESVSELGLWTENQKNLLIETLAELSRLTGYSYDYLVNDFMQINDDNYVLLVNVLRHLHRAYNWSFETLADKFHLTKDILNIRARCNF